MPSEKRPIIFLFIKDYFIIIFMPVEYYSGLVVLQNLAPM